MSTHNICFQVGIRKALSLFGKEKVPNLLKVCLLSVLTFSTQEKIFSRHFEIIFLFFPGNRI